MKRFILGLTGSIGMGKSTTAVLFAAQGVPIWDADAVVHRLYEVDGKATQIVASLYPDVIEEGRVSRSLLRKRIAADASVLDHVQKMVHPLVAANRAQFLAAHTEGLVLLDIPLLFETGSEGICDGIAVVSTDSDTQRSRVLARGEMSEQDFDLILSRQMPDSEKRKRATWVIPTDSPTLANQAVEAIITIINQRLANA